MPADLRFWLNVLFWDSGFGMVWLVLAMLIVLGFYLTGRSSTTNVGR